MIEVALLGTILKTGINIVFSEHIKMIGWISIRWRYKKR